MRLNDKVLLISNSTVYGHGYLDHVESEIKSFLGRARRVLFFPFALHDRDTYAATARARFGAMGYSIESAHETDVPQKAVEETDAIFIGGGNTFRLLKALEDLDLIEPIRRKVNSGAPYIGSSAGSNVAGPTIKTTKDMVTASPPVSPRVVARILMIQKRIVTCGTLTAIASRFESRVCIGFHSVIAAVLERIFDVWASAQDRIRHGGP